MTPHRPARGAALRWTGAATLCALILNGTTALAAPTLQGTSPKAIALASSVITPETWPHPTTPASDDDAEEYGKEAVRIRTAEIREPALTRICGPTELGSEARFPLFEDTVVEAAEVSRETIGGVLTWHGEVEGTTDQEVIVTLKGGCDGTQGNEELSAHFMLGGAVYDIVPDGPGRVRVMQSTPDTDEDDKAIVPPKSRPIEIAAPAPQHARTPEAHKAACKGGDTISVIDVLAVYSPKARTEAGGDTQMKAQIAKGIALTNDAFATSGVKARVRLVHSAYISGISSTYDTQSSAALLAFAKKSDGVADTIPTLRDTYGADQVTVITGGSKMGGIGYTPETPGPAWKEWAYTIVAQNAISHYTFGHELGHNLGANHDWTTEPSQPDNGAAGYFPSNGAWSTLMAYESSCRTATSGTCSRINRFSNYDQTYRGKKLGTKPTATHAADSAPFFNSSAEAVSAYRTAKTDSVWCDVTPSSSPSVKAGRIVPKLMGPYTKTATATFTAVPARGYVFSYWTLDGKKQSSRSKTIKVSMKSKDHTLKATFKKGTSSTSTVSTSSSGSGSVSSSSKTGARAPAGVPVLEGAELHYTARPKAGHHFAGWTLDGSYAGDDPDIHLRVGEDNSTLTAIFEPADLTLTTEVRGGKGTIRLSSAGPYADGDTIHAVAVPAKGYRFVDWLLDGEAYGGDEEDHEACTAVHFDESGHTLTAVFEAK